MKVIQTFADSWECVEEMNMKINAFSNLYTELPIIGAERFQAFVVLACYNTHLPL